MKKLLSTILAPCRRKWLILACAALTTIVSAITLLSFERYIKTSDQLLSQPHTPWEQHGSGLISITNDHVEISNRHGNSSALVHSISVAPNTKLAYSFTAHADNIKAGSKHWENANLGLIYYDHNNRRLDSRILISLEGTATAKRYSGTIQLPDKTNRLEVAIRLNNSSGTFGVSNINIYQVSESTTYTTIRTLIQLLWAALLVPLSIFLYQSQAKKQVARLTAVATAVAVLLCMPESIIYNINRHIASLSPILFNSTSTPDISALGHVVLFFFIGLYLGKLYLQQHPLYIVLIIPTIALFTEVLQLLTGERTFSTSDFFTDCISAYVALLVCYALSKRPFKISLTHIFSPTSNSKHSKWKPTSREDFKKKSLHGHRPVR